MFQGLLSINSAVGWTGGIHALALTRTNAASLFSVDQNYFVFTTVGQRFIIGSVLGGGGSVSIKFIEFHLVVLTERKSLSVSDAFPRAGGGDHLWRLAGRGTGTLRTAEILKPRCLKPPVITYALTRAR